MALAIAPQTAPVQTASAVGRYAPLPEPAVRGGGRLRHCGVRRSAAHARDRRPVGVRHHAVGHRRAPSGTVGGVVRRGAGLAGFGIAIGLWAAYALSRFMQGILYDVAATDAVMYVEALCDRGIAERASRRRRGASYAPNPAHILARRGPTALRDLP